LSGLIESGEEIEIYWGYYDRFQAQRGDIVAYRYAGNLAPLIKIIHGMPGDTFALVENTEDGLWYLMINGEALRTSSGQRYALSEDRAKLLRQYEKDYQGTIPQGAFIILGNNPRGSVDSSQFGFASKNNFLGKVGR
ncbi:MAG: signal peptidase I, partial [Candidatus Harrisonbacteria bacterium]|nr:signal peptidase I [Candidatus Harrisonbacteria bacterium]